MQPKPAPRSLYARGLALTAFGGLVLTADIPLIKLADGAPWSIVFLRSGTTLLVTLCVWLVWRRLSRTAPPLVPGRTGLAVALLYGGCNTFFMLGIFLTSTANLVFIVALSSMFVALFCWAALGERPKPATVLTMFALIVGIAIIVGDGFASGRFLGDLFALGATLCIAGAITITRASGKDMGLAALVGATLPFVVSVCVLLWSGTGLDVAQPFWVLLDGAIVAPLAFFCLATGPRYISGPEVAMFYLLETVLAPIWVWMIFSEVPSANTLWGGAILIGALLAHSFWQLSAARRVRAA